MLSNNTFYCTKVYLYGVLRRTTACYDVLRRTTAYYDVLQRITMCPSSGRVLVQKAGDESTSIGIGRQALGICLDRERFHGKERWQLQKCLFNL